MKILFTRHALEKMEERNIAEEEVEKVIRFGMTIERYPHDKPFPSRLVHGVVNGRPLHVVVADASEEVKYVITAYEPSPEKWEANFTRRKKL